jgi:hypothetical protein
MEQKHIVFAQDLIVVICLFSKADFYLMGISGYEKLFVMKNEALIFPRDYASLQVI